MNERKRYTAHRREVNGVERVRKVLHKKGGANGK